VTLLVAIAKVSPPVYEVPVGSACAINPNAWLAIAGRIDTVRSDSRSIGFPVGCAKRRRPHARGAERLWERAVQILHLLVSSISAVAQSLLLWQEQAGGLALRSDVQGRSLYEFRIRRKCLPGLACLQAALRVQDPFLLCHHTGRNTTTRRHREDFTGAHLYRPENSAGG